MTDSHDDEPMYERDDRPEPDPDTWLEDQADAAWQALPAWRRAIERVRAWWYRRWTLRRRQAHSSEEPPF